MIPGSAQFLAAIQAAPDDDAPRLVFADWLDDHGDAARAEFIRVQCELARRPSAAGRARAAELLAGHHDAFAGPLAAPGLRFNFGRGFVVAFGHPGAFVDRNKRTDVMYLLRFYPDGLVITDATPGIRPVEEVLPDFHRENRHLASARYTVTWADPPVGVSFSTVSEDTGYRFDYRGVFRKTSLHVEMGSPGERWHRPRRYQLEPIAGFHTAGEGE